MTPTDKLELQANYKFVLRQLNNLTVVVETMIKNLENECNYGECPSCKSSKIEKSTLIENNTFTKVNVCNKCGKWW